MFMCSRRKSVIIFFPLESDALLSFKKRPDRRSKSQQEPIIDAKYVEKMLAANYALAKIAEKVARGCLMQPPTAWLIVGSWEQRQWMEWK